MRILFNTTSYSATNNYNSAYQQNLNFSGRQKLNIPKDVLENLIEEGLNETTIAKRLGIRPSHLISLLTKHKLETKPRIAQNKLIDDVENLVLQGFSCTQMGKMYNMKSRDAYYIAIKVLGADGYKKCKRKGDILRASRSQIVPKKQKPQKVHELSPKSIELNFKILSKFHSESDLNKIKAQMERKENPEEDIAIRECLREKLKPLLQKKCSKEEIKRNMGFPLEKIIDFIVGKNL